MTTNDVLAEIRESLNGRPGQPILFGVCRSLAERFGQEPWAYRAAAILLALFYTLPAIAAYIVLGFALIGTIGCGSTVHGPSRSFVRAIPSVR